jgi:hypothetical protein
MTASNYPACLAVLPENNSGANHKKVYLTEIS